MGLEDLNLDPLIIDPPLLVAFLIAALQKPKIKINKIKKTKKHKFFIALISTGIMELIAKVYFVCPLWSLNNEISMELQAFMEMKRRIETIN